MAFFDTLKEIRDMIPKEETEITYEMGRLYQTICYRAPELINNSVMDFHTFLSTYVDPQTVWGKKIQNKWTLFIISFNSEHKN